MKSTDYLRNFAKDLVNDPVLVRRNQIFAGIDRLVGLEWELPKQATQIKGIHKMIAPDPAENIERATNAVAGSMLQVHIDPLRNDEGSRELANHKEQMVKWWLSKLDRREEGSVIEKIANSAFRYDMVAFRTDHVDYVQRANARLKGEEAERSRDEYMAQGGPFGWCVYHPATVYPMFSARGLESVLLCEVKPVHKVLAYYGSSARKLETKLKSHTNGSEWLFKYVTEYYYCDREVVYCWVVPSETNSLQAATSADAVDIYREPNDLGFLRWVVKTSETLDTRDKIRPMLYNAWKSGWWESQNLTETLRMTALIQNTGKPDFIYTPGAAGDAMPKVDYTHLVGGIIVNPLGGELRETQPAISDPALIQQSERFRDWQARAGSSPALAGAVTDETFAGANLQVGIGASSIESGRKLIEAALSAGGLQFFQWAEYVGEEMTVPGEGDTAPRDGYTLNPRELDIGSLYLSVTLKEGKPGANIQVNNAMAIAKQFGLSNHTALETAGYENPEREINLSYQEMLERTRVENQIKLESAQTDAQIQMLMTQMQQALAPPPPVPAEPPAMPPQDIYSEPVPFQALNPSSLPEGLGQGLNANAGGTPPALLNPNLTRENQTGLAANGSPLYRP